MTKGQEVGGVFCRGLSQWGNPRTPEGSLVFLSTNVPPSGKSENHCFEAEKAARGGESQGRGGGRATDGRQLRPRSNMCRYRYYSKYTKEIGKYTAAACLWRLPRWTAACCAQPVISPFEQECCLQSTQTLRVRDLPTCVVKLPLYSSTSWQS